MRSLKINNNLYYNGAIWQTLRGVHRGTDGRDHFWQLGVGTKFGAYSVKARKKNI